MPDPGWREAPRPHALLLLGCLLLVPATAGARSRASYRSSTERVVFQLLNTIRRQHHLPPFTFSAALRSSAREHSADMLAHQYFEHNAPNETFDHRIRRHLDSSLVGENIAWGTGKYATPEGLVKLWMHSPTHRHIILMRSLHRVRPGRRDRHVRRQPGRRDGDRRLRRLVRRPPRAWTSRWRSSTRTGGGLAGFPCTAWRTSCALEGRTEAPTSANVPRPATVERGRHAVRDHRDHLPGRLRDVLP